MYSFLLILSALGFSVAVVTILVLSKVSRLRIVIGALSSFVISASTLFINANWLLMSPQDYKSVSTPLSYSAGGIIALVILLCRDDIGKAIKKIREVSNK